MSFDNEDLFDDRKIEERGYSIKDFIFVRSVCLCPSVSRSLSPSVPPSSSELASNRRTATETISYVGKIEEWQPTNIYLCVCGVCVCVCTRQGVPICMRIRGKSSPVIYNTAPNYSVRYCWGKKYFV